MADDRRGLPRHRAPEPALARRPWNDAFIGIPSLRLADGLAGRGADVWTYRFDHVPARPFTATHGSDIPFVFGLPTAAVFPTAWNDTEQALARQLHGAVVSFVRTGNPNIPELSTWPRHTPDGLAFMVFDAQPWVSRDFVGAARRAAWAPVPNSDI